MRSARPQPRRSGVLQSAGVIPRCVALRERYTKCRCAGGSDHAASGIMRSAKRCIRWVCASVSPCRFTSMCRHRPLDARRHRQSVVVQSGTALAVGGVGATVGIPVRAVGESQGGRIAPPDSWAWRNLRGVVGELLRRRYGKAWVAADGIPGISQASRPAQRHGTLRQSDGWWLGGFGAKATLAKRRYFPSNVGLSLVRFSRHGCTRRPRSRARRRRARQWPRTLRASSLHHSRR